MKIKTLIIFLLIFFVAFGIYKALTFKLFDESNHTFKEVFQSEKPYKIRVYQISSNAVTKSVIQVRKVVGTEEIVLENFEDYNYVEEQTIEGDYLKLKLKDTLENFPANTVYIKLP